MEHVYRVGGVDEGGGEVGWKRYTEKEGMDWAVDVDEVVGLLGGSRSALARRGRVGCLHGGERSGRSAGRVSLDFK